jgi:hypothetical protein
MRVYRRGVIARAGARRTVTTAAVAAAALATVLLTGCAHRHIPGHVVLRTVTVTPSPTAASTAATTSPTATPSEAVHMRNLPGTCADLLSLGTIVNALGHPVSGDTAFVVGLPDAATGRLSYIDCRYGVTSAAATPDIEIGVNLYRTPAKAAARIGPTVNDFTAHGASATPATVAGQKATVLLGGRGSGYEPTVVLADGQRTIAVTVNRTGSGVSAELLRLALLADQRTS